MYRIFALFKNINDDIINNYDGWFQSSKQNTDNMFLVLKIPHKFDIPIEMNNLEKPYLFKIKNKSFI